jgi:hypothetical protein
VAQLRDNTAETPLAVITKTSMNFLTHHIQIICEYIHSFSLCNASAATEDMRHALATIMAFEKPKHSTTKQH